MKPFAQPAMRKIRSEIGIGKIQSCKKKQQEGEQYAQTLYPTAFAVGYKQNPQDH